MSLSAIFTDPVVLQWTFGALTAQLIANIVIANVKSPMQSKYGAAAHQLVCFIPFMYASKAGLRMWFSDPVLAEQWASDDYAARYLHCTSAQHTLVKMMLGFQIYDVLATGLVPELRKLEHLMHHIITCLLYTSPSPRDGLLSRMPSSA